MNIQFLTVAEVAKILHVSKSHAYKVVHRLNRELQARGILTIAGRISRDYLMERMTGTDRRKEAEDNGGVPSPCRPS